jgi:hypothetical protein
MYKYFHLVLIGLLIHTFSTEFAFKTPRAVTRASPPCGGTKNDGSYADTFNTGDAPLSRRTGSRSPCHYSHQSWCTGVWIRFGLPRRNF